jgi:DnaJ-class molecular chaperone
MSRCHGPVTDLETGVQDCRFGGDLVAACRECGGEGLVAVKVLGVLTARGSRLCPECRGSGVVDRCARCGAAL